MHMKPELTKLSKKNFHIIVEQKDGKRANISYRIWNLNWCDKCCYISKLRKGKLNLGRI